MKKVIKVAILGCTRYTGIELVNILIKHPNVKITFLGTHNFEGKNIYFFDKRLKNKKLPKLELIKNVDCSSIDLVFLSLPHNISQNIIKNNYGKCKFIDLSIYRFVDLPFHRFTFLSVNRFIFLSLLCLNDFPELTSIETRASVGLITRYPPDLSFTSDL